LLIVATATCCMTGGGAKGFALYLTYPRDGN